MTVLLYLLGIALVVPAILERLLFLAPTPLGALVYYANVFGELFVKRVGVPRGAAELAAAGVGVIFMALAGPGLVGVVVGLVVALAIAGLDIWCRMLERRITETIYAHPDSIGVVGPPRPAEARLPEGTPGPSVHPHLTISLVGPFVSRRPAYDLGDLVVGRRMALEVLVGNHTIVPGQDGVALDAAVSGPLRIVEGASATIPPLASGAVHVHTMVLEVTGVGEGGRITLDVTSGDTTQRVVVGSRSSREATGRTIASASVTRYPGAATSAFSWRGDMDLYDTSTFQSIAGLEVTLGLGARYRIPQTMYVSTRLTLDEAAARAHAEHYGVSRGHEEIPRFIEWIRDNAALVHRMPYPTSTDKRYVFEMGNHGHLHYGTDMAAAPENGWTPRAKIGAGSYPWVGDDKSSFGEQRDNALEARRLMEELFGYTPKSWAMPDRTRDAETPRAMEAAGCEVLSDSDVRTADNVLYQPPPHHPMGTAAVELTKRYPGDPQHVYHWAMNQFWLHRGLRLGIPVIFMCHQHMRRFDGYATERHTEHVLRYVLDELHGDMYIDTVYGIGIYWKDLMSPTHRTVRVTVEGGAVVITSESQRGHSRVPVDVTYTDGGRATMLVDVPEHSSIRLDGVGTEARREDP